MLHLSPPHDARRNRKLHSARHFTLARASFAAVQAREGLVGLAFPRVPIFSTRILSAASVGSPTLSYFPFTYITCAWLLREHTLAKSPAASPSKPSTSPQGS